MLQAFLNKVAGITDMEKQAAALDSAKGEIKAMRAVVAEGLLIAGLQAPGNALKQALEGQLQDFELGIVGPADVLPQLLDKARELVSQKQTLPAASKKPKK